MIPFSVTIPPQKRDRYLVEKLCAELPGILNWALSGYLEWQKTGLLPPEKVIAATKSYREELDELGRFLLDMCVIDEFGRVTVDDLYNAYIRYMGEEGKITKTKLGRLMFERGFDQGQEPTGKRWRFWIGIRFRESVDGD